MKAAIYLGKENIEIRDLPMLECGENDVIGGIKKMLF